MKLLSLVLLTAGLALNAEAQIIPFEGIRTINGTKLYFRIFGTGEPLLAVHGGPGLNHTYFLPHLESLSKDFTVILYDERACGRSVIPDTDSLGLKFFVDDIDAIRKDLGLEKINILGHSWGAIPVVRYGIDYPEKVKSMVLCNAVALSHEFDSEIAAIQKKRNTPEDSIERANILNSPDFKSGQTKAYEKLMSLAFRHSFTSSKNASKLHVELPENYLKAGTRLFSGLIKDLRQYDYYSSVGRFNFPVLILHGQFDALPLKISQKLQVSIPRSQLIVFENSGHFIFIEEQKKFKSSLIAFMKPK